MAGFLHDIGNVAGRKGHGQAGALLAERILSGRGLRWEEIAEIMGAIGNHEEEYGQVVNRLSAVLILADKSDVHRSRVRNDDAASFDIHDRVNHAVEHSFLQLRRERRRSVLN